jgi:hypothetical protein
LTIWYNFPDDRFLLCCQSTFEYLLLIIISKECLFFFLIITVWFFSDHKTIIIQADKGSLQHVFNAKITIYSFWNKRNLRTLSSLNLIFLKKNFLWNALKAYILTRFFSINLVWLVMFNYSSSYFRYIDLSYSYYFQTMESIYEKNRCLFFSVNDS